MSRCPAPGSIVSDHVEGTRLSDMLRVAHERNLQLDINAALCLIRQLVAVALLHENAREVAHGLIAPERLVVTPHARLVIVEHVLSAAVEQLQFSRDRLWQEFRIAMPPSAGMSRFDHRADVTGIGLVALSLVLGRPLHQAEFPNHLPTLLNEARERTALGEEQLLSPSLRDWLARALQLDTRRAFASASEALSALEEIVADDSMAVAAPVSLETFLSRYIAALLELPSDPVPAAPSAAFAATAAPATVPAAPAAPPAAAPSRYATAPAQGAAFDLLADVTTSATAGTGARSITELITAGDLTAPLDSSDKGLTLFNPDAPFSVSSDPASSAQSDALFSFQTDPLSAKTGTPPGAAPKAFGDRTGCAVHGYPCAGRTGRARVEAQIHGPKTQISRKALLAAAALVVVVGGGVYASRFMIGAGVSEPQTGTLFVQSNPAGVPVFVDGKDYGQTPARFAVPVARTFSSCAAAACPGD